MAMNVNDPRSYNEFVVSRFQTKTVTSSDMHCGRVVLIAEVA
jgi:hypothetical protein